MRKKNEGLPDSFGIERKRNYFGEFRFPYQHIEEKGGHF